MFPDGRTADDDYRGLVDFNRELDAQEEPGLLSRLLATGRLIGRGMGEVNDVVSSPEWSDVDAAQHEIALMMDPREGIDQSIRSAQDGDYVSALAEGALSMPMVATFAGRAAKTADLGALTKAQELDEFGAGRREIWDETGWFKGPDDKWRFEIDDSMAQFDTNRLPKEMGLKGLMDDYAKREFGVDSVARLPANSPERNAAIQYAQEISAGSRDNLVGLPSVVKHPELMEAYDLSNIGIGRENTGRFKGSFNINDNVVRVSDQDQLSTALHETQHVVQGREGFAPGGSPNGNVRQIIQEADQQLGAINDRLKNIYRAKQAFEEAGDAIGVRNADVEYRRVMQQKEEILETAAADPMDVYRRLAGEVEARNVQTRRDFTPEQRRAQAPWETQDVPDDLQIVRMGGDGPQMSLGRFDFSDARPQSARVGKASLDYTVNPDGRTVTLDTLSTPERARGQGEAKRALDEFLSEADQNGMTVELTVQPTEGGMPKERLRRLYERAGFVDVPGWREVGIDKMRRAPPTNPLLD
jgi:GNAT superfamily N-acetyltransferase